MFANEYPFTLGTAGHVDHGKTLLVKQLTGIDCDRLEEEKKRGITIDLGFAPLTLPSGKVISIVDVPGHEKFVKHMIPGASGIDAAMLVVAADDGVMPQTLEHIAILSLLDVSDGIIVINKTDLVNQDKLEQVLNDVRTAVCGTFLQNKPIITASATTGEGIEKIINEIELLTARAKKRKTDKSFFMPVDRVFHIHGFGTIVTGTPQSGIVTADRNIEILPGKKNVHIRSIEVHSHKVHEACAGQRTALNLAAVSVDEIKSGDVIADKDVFAVTTSFFVSLRMLPNARPLKNMQRIMFYTGTLKTTARIALINHDKIVPSKVLPAMIITETPVAISFGKRFIIRTITPSFTCGGGKILINGNLDFKDKSRKAKLAELLTKLSYNNISINERIIYVIEYKGIISVNEIAQMNEITSSELMRNIANFIDNGKIIVAHADEQYLIAKEKVAEIISTLKKYLTQLNNIDITFDESSKILRIANKKLLSAIFKICAEKNLLNLNGNNISFVKIPSLANESLLNECIKLKEYCLCKMFILPSIKEAEDELNFTHSKIKKLIDFMKNNKELTILADNFILLKQIELIFIEKLNEIDGITIASVRNITGSSRKYLIPLLEYLDGKGITKRSGDKRILVNKMKLN